MPRPMSTAMTAWLTGSELPCAVFFEGTFRSGPVFLWTGYGSIERNGKTWIGIGTLGGVTAIDEGSTLEAKGITVSLSGIDPATLSLVLDEFLLGAPANTFLAGFNDGVLIDNPILSFSGGMDQPSIDVDRKTAAIAINCENELVEMNVAVDRRYTSDDQQRDWPGDLGMNFVNSIQEMTIYFNGAPTTTGNL